MRVGALNVIDYVIWFTQPCALDLVVNVSVYKDKDMWWIFTGCLLLFILYKELWVETYFKVHSRERFALYRRLN